MAQQQQPGNQQPGNEARANDIPMNPQPTQQDKDLAVSQYLQMKNGMDKRINTYSITRADLNKKGVRSLAKWAKDNCESVVKLLSKESTKAKKVDLLVDAIAKQRILDLKILQTCRDHAIKLGVAADKLPWGYGELDADDAKDGEAGDDNNDDGDKEFNKQIQKLYKELKDLQVKHAKYGVRAAQNNKDDNNDNGKDQDDQKLDAVALSLKNQIIAQMSGIRNRVPARDVS